MNESQNRLTPENFPPYAFAFYRVAINEAARLAVRSFMDFSEVIEEGGPPSEAAGLLHDAINHCASISRFFWPTSKAGAVGKYRAGRLRELYRVDADSPLNTRELRNELEHLDEKIDNWLSFNPTGPIIPNPIFGSHSIADDGFGHAFKVIDVQNSIYVVMGKKFEFASLSRAAAEILLREDEG